MIKRRPIMLACIALIAAFAITVTVSKTFRENLIIYGLIVYSDLTKPNDPITRAIRTRPSREWGSEVVLIPYPFSRGETESDVDRLLARGRYQTDKEALFSPRNSKQFPDGSRFYTMNVTELPCNIRYEVVVRYDDQGRLTDASGTSDEAGCL